MNACCMHVNKPPGYWVIVIVNKFELSQNLNEIQWNTHSRILQNNEYIHERRAMQAYTYYKDRCLTALGTLNEEVSSACWEIYGFLLYIGVPHPIMILGRPYIGP